MLASIPGCEAACGLSGAGLHYRVADTGTKAVLTGTQQPAQRMLALLVVIGVFVREIVPLGQPGAEQPCIFKRLNVR